MPTTVVVVTETPHAVELLFDASLDIDAHVGSMSHSGEEAVAGVTSGRIGLGESVTWRARHFGVRLTMTTRITELERPHRFVDEQIAGPFRSFHHIHEFERRGGVTIMTDTLTLASPVFGALAERLVLAPYLRRLLRRRNAFLLGMLDAAH